MNALPKTIQEFDPGGLAPNMPGAKLDAHKPRAGLVLRGFGNALLAVAQVGTFGAKKYTENGWMAVPNGEARYTDAAFRHLLAPDETDSESDLPHLAHAAWNALAALELRLRGSPLEPPSDE